MSIVSKVSIVQKIEKVRDDEGAQCFNGLNSVESFNSFHRFKSFNRSGMRVGKVSLVSISLKVSIVVNVLHISKCPGRVGRISINFCHSLGTSKTALRGPD